MKRKAAIQCCMEVTQGAAQRVLSSKPASLRDTVALPQAQGPAHLRRLHRRRPYHSVFATRQGLLLRAGNRDSTRLKLGVRATGARAGAPAADAQAAAAQAAAVPLCVCSLADIAAESRAQGLEIRD